MVTYCPYCGNIVNLVSFSGAYGAAVLYKKKDDESLVILKEINLYDLTAQERMLAANEVYLFMNVTSLDSAIILCIL